MTARHLLRHPGFEIYLPRRTIPRWTPSDAPSSPAGPTREPIDAVRFISNRSSGKMGAALADAALRAGHEVTLVVGPVLVAMPERARRVDVETAADMHAAVMRLFPEHDLLLMAAAVADFRPRYVRDNKIERDGTLAIEFEATEDIVAAASRAKRPDQRTVGFSLESVRKRRTRPAPRCSARALTSSSTTPRPR